MSTQVRAAPPPPTAQSSEPVISAAPKIYLDGKQLTSPNAVYQGLVHQQQELTKQMDALKDERSNAGTWLREQHDLAATDRAGLEKRIVTVDARIEALEKQRAVVDAQVASAAAVPGAVVDPPPPERDGPPEAVVGLGIMFMLVAILPISVAFARRIWRKSAKAVAALPNDILERFSQLDQAVESIAVEVERIGEGQRFITRVMSEQGSRAALGQGAAKPIEQQMREGAEVPRR